MELEPTKKEVEVIAVKPEKNFAKRLLDRRSAYEILTLHFFCLLAPFHFNWGAFCVALALYILTLSLGITLSYHRNLAHKSFKLPKWLEYSFAYIGVHAFQGDPIDWVSTHRYHHKFTDSSRDPHSPTEGFWYAHMGWIFDSYALMEKVSPKDVRDFEAMGGRRKVFGDVFARCSKYGRASNVEDLQKQAFYRFLKKTYILHPILLGLLLYAKGGLPFFVWGICVRTVFALHATFCVNSICHMWGYRTWNTADLSRNNWVIGLLAFGEGWHNNHHAFEYSARHGLQRWEFDFTWLVISFLQAIGLATDVKLPSQLHKKKLAMTPTKAKAMQ